MSATAAILRQPPVAAFPPAASARGSRIGEHDRGQRVRGQLLMPDHSPAIAADAKRSMPSRRERVAIPASCSITIIPCFTADARGPDSYAATRKYVERSAAAGPLVGPSIECASIRTGRSSGHRGVNNIWVVDRQHGRAGGDPILTGEQGCPLLRRRRMLRVNQGSQGPPAAAPQSPRVPPASRRISPSSRCVRARWYDQVRCLTP